MVGKSPESPLSSEKHQTSGPDLHLYSTISQKHPLHPCGTLNTPLPPPYIHAKLTSVTPTPPGLLGPSWLFYTGVRDSQWGGLFAPLSVSLVANGPWNWFGPRSWKSRPAGVWRAGREPWRRIVVVSKAKHQCVFAVQSGRPWLVS